MGKPVVHFEIIGKHPEKLQSYYGALFGWTYDNSNPPASEINERPGKTLLYQTPAEKFAECVAAIG